MSSICHLYHCQPRPDLLDSIFISNNLRNHSISRFSAGDKFSTSDAQKDPIRSRTHCGTRHCPSYRSPPNSNVLDTKCSTLTQCRKGDAWNCLSLANKKNTILNNLISVLTHHWTNQIKEWETWVKYTLWLTIRLRKLKYWNVINLLLAARHKCTNWHGTCRIPVFFRCQTNNPI